MSTLAEQGLEISVRAVGMFFILLGLIRLGGARIFGKKSSFDSAVVIMLGAIAARGVIDGTLFWPTALACSVITAIHWALARISVSSKRLDRFLTGEPV